MSQSEVYVLEVDKMIQGFVGINDEYIEGIFVSHFAPRYFIRSCGKHAVQQCVLRKVVHKGNDHISKEQKPLAGTRMGHIGKLVRGNSQLLCQNLTVSLGLVEHIRCV